MISVKARRLGRAYKHPMDIGTAIDRSWAGRAVERIAADFRRSADTHLLVVPVPGFRELDLYLKDESTHPTGSLKHRLARSLVLYGLCNGWIGPETTLVEASSGSTAISVAYFARLLGLRFVAVLPVGTALAKRELIRRYGGQCEEVASAEDMVPRARALADDCGGHFLDQFTHAERATDWRGNNNIAESLFEQLALEAHPEPDWLVCGAGTGGTSATLGRYIRYRGFRSRLCVVDPEHSRFLDAYTGAAVDTQACPASRIEGIGRPRMEASFLPSVVDAMLRVPDAASFAAARFLSAQLGRPVGASTGTNLIGVLHLMQDMDRDSRGGSIASLICDDGSRYRDTFFDTDWLADHYPRCGEWESWVATLWQHGAGPAPPSALQLRGRASWRACPATVS